MLKKVLSFTFIAAALACSASPKPQQMVDGVANIKPDEHQKFVTRQVVSLIENYNYKKQKINDSISSIVLDRYIKALDPSRYYFWPVTLKALKNLERH